MSDLSRLLGDVYGTGPAEKDAVEPTDAPVADAPSWADESLLDEAFADWVPGPPSDAPADERAALTDLAAGPAPEPVGAQPVPATLAEALPAEAEWFFDVPAEPVAAETPVAEPVADADTAAPVVPWQRADDDLLPSKGRRRTKR